MRFRTLLLMAAVLFLLAGQYLPVWSGTLYVRTDGNDSNTGLDWIAAKATIQSALTDAQAGDEIWVKTGTYFGPFSMKNGVALYGGFVGTETSLTQRNSQANQTILDGNQQSPVITGPVSATEATVIDGFTITHAAAADESGDDHAAVFFSSSSPTLSHNTITANDCDGIRCLSSSPIIKNNLVVGNSGSGISLSSSSGELSGNAILANGGGGVYCAASSPAILRNRIVGNDSGGIYCESSSPVIANNMVSGNVTMKIGGGIDCCTGSSPIIANNTITSNTAYLEGGGLHIDSSCSVVIVNNIISFNSSGLYMLSESSVLRNNDVYGNRDYGYAGIVDPTGTQGNIAMDPLFASAEDGISHIRTGSPCIDTGDDSIVQAAWTDIDGLSRIYSSHVDIGADEFDGTQPPAGPSIIVRVSPAGNDLNDGSSWSSAKRTIQAAIDSAFTSGGEVWVASGEYDECIVLQPYVFVYGGFAGSETTRSQRDWARHETIIDGGRQGRVVSIQAGLGVNCINGFTIRNGKAALGAGVHCYLAAPEISNNKIIANDGGGIYCYNSPAVICNNSIINNSADLSFGSGIFCDHSKAVITNNTICRNYADDGGGIHCYYSEAKITNNIIAFNSSGVSVAGSSVPVLTANDVFGNASYAFSGIPDPTGTSGNISADPMIAGVDYCHYHIQPDSPCRNAGDDEVITIGWLDIDGQVRIEGSHVDIGADESDGTAWSSDPPAIVRVTPTGNDSSDGSTWTLAKRTVQAGLDALRQTGGELWVSAGTYIERIDIPACVYLYGGFAGSETTRADRNPAANVTILDGGSGGSVVTAGTGRGCIDGFTIRNGTGTRRFGSLCGGGVYCTFPAFVVSNDVITGNSADNGGGVYGNAVVSNCRISGNNARSNGGGVSTVGCHSLVSGNSITDNSAGGKGGGVFGDGTIINNSISGNTASGSGGGVSGTGVISNNIVANNQSTGFGGGICGSSLISGNTVLANSAISFDARINVSMLGAGIYGTSKILGNTVKGNFGSGISGFGIIANNIVAGNSTGINWNLVYARQPNASFTNNTIVNNSGNGVSFTGSSTCYTGTLFLYNNIIANNVIGINWGPSFGPSIVLHNNDVFGNILCAYSRISAPPATDGNIAVDPKLADVKYGNMHLMPDSPCRNTGDDSIVQPEWTDIDGQNRLQGSHADIGADETNGDTWQPGPSTVVRVSPTGSDSNDGSTWDHAKRSVQAAIDAASVAGGDVWVASGIYEGSINLHPHAHLYGGFSGTETSRDQRDWRHNITILDGQARGSVVSIKAGNAVHSIDGFTIRNGTSDLGGGVYSPVSSEIVNNTVTGNSATSDGGGIYCYLSTVRNNIITGNTGTLRGGGIYGKSSIVVNNLITQNTSSSGGGVCINEETSSYLLYTEPASVITNNTICQNNASSTGGGIYYPYNDNLSMYNNIIALNSGGGVVCPYMSVNSLLATANNYWSNTGGNWNGEPYLPEGCFSYNPQFVNSAAGDYSLNSKSYCINLGKSDAPGIPTFDLNGNPRVNEGQVDLGAYEFQYAPQSIGSLKNWEDGTWVSLHEVTVTAAFTDYFYIGTDDRSSGICVRKQWHAFTPGMKVDVTGHLYTDANGERYIAADTVYLSSNPASVNGITDIAKMDGNNGANPRSLLKIMQW